LTIKYDYIGGVIFPLTELDSSPAIRFPGRAGCGHPASGMSLTELLVVMVILVIGATLVVPSIGGLMRSGRLEQSGETLAGHLRLARQHALTQNRPVEVRLFRLGSGESYHFLAYQYFVISEDGTPVAKAPLQRLPDSVFLDPGRDLSSILGESSSSVFSPHLATGAQLGLELPGEGTSYEAVRFRFLPDGSTDLPRTRLWFLTLHGVEDSLGSSEPPPNYFTLQIEPSNGHVKSYRP
jgi:uncharacterized protein (TIGR02596 family)